MQCEAFKFNDKDRRSYFKILSKMATSGKIQVISTKYFIYISQKYYVIYLQNIKFVWLIVWPEGMYTDNTYATKPESRSHIMVHFMNHDYIGSLECIPNEPKRTTTITGFDRYNMTNFKQIL